MTVLPIMFCTMLSTVAFAVDREVYDTIDVRPGTTIEGKVTQVDEKASQTWNVSVKDSETGHVVVLHVDKTTSRKDNMLSPKLGTNVIAKYNSQNHAISFLTDQTMNR